MSSQPAALTRFAGERSFPSHLTKHRGAVSACQSDLRTERECYCRACQNRVTLGPEWEGEYGHEPDCEFSARRKDSHSLVWRGESDD